MKEKEPLHIQPALRMFEQAAIQIVEYISSEQLSQGSKIPPERTISQLLEISRSSVREGLRVLELLRYLDSKQGEGTFVSEPPPYIIPSRVIQQPLKPEFLKYYYGIAMMCAEQIVMLSLQQSIRDPYSVNESDSDFWTEFARWIEHLGTQLPNPYLLSLWKNTHELLMENHGFLPREASVNLREWMKAYSEKDEVALKPLFLALSEIH